MKQTIFNREVFKLASNGTPLSNVSFGFTWGSSMGMLGLPIESANLKVSAVLLNENDEEVETVYFGHKTSRDKSIVLTEHSFGSDFDMDKNVITLHLGEISPNIDKIALIINSPHHIPEVPYIGMRIFEGAQHNSRHLEYYESKDDLQGSEGIILGILSKSDDSWKLQICGEKGPWHNIRSIIDYLPSLLGSL